MLEKLNKSGFETISAPDLDVCSLLEEVLNDGNDHPVVAEIGVGIGATTQALSKILNNRGVLHVYDYNSKLAELLPDLDDLGFKNIVPYPNTTRYWDSYNWSLMRLFEKEKGPIYDIIYLDGAHTFQHDALAFVLCDKLLKNGGFMVFDDYYWCFSDSKYMVDNRDQFMTEEQINTRQIALIIQLLVEPDPRYREIMANKGYKKVVGAADGN